MKASLWFLGLCVMLAGCGNSSPQNSPDNQAENKDKKLTIAMIPKGTTHEFWKSVEAGARKAANELGVEIIWKVHSKKTTKTTKLRQLKTSSTQS
jgi:ribose transport system substrate-binding protein